ncbi:hypothetical protein GOP47_0021106, partial [Adiantum capillus-veneris]
LTRRDYKEENDKDVIELVDGNMSKHLLSWDMTFCLMLQDGQVNWLAKKGEEKVLEGASFVVDQDTDDKEEFLSKAQEASMALVMVQRRNLVTQEEANLLTQNQGSFNQNALIT